MPYAEKGREGLRQLEKRLKAELRRSLMGQELLSDEEIRGRCREIVASAGIEKELSLQEKRHLTERIYHTVRGLDILQELIEDEEISEIMVNGPEHIFIEKAGRLMLWPESFDSVELLEDVIRRIVGSCNRVINESCPVADARLPDGSRINAVLPPVALDGPVLTVRRFPREPIRLENLVQRGSLTEEAAADLGKFVRGRYSILISGGTSAGKTTFLNALSGMMPPSERVITIEDNAELCLQGLPNLVRLEARPENMEGNAAVSIRDLIRTSLRMRPDRLIVGEVRGEEAQELLQALNTGHSGSLSTIHANSASDALTRLETLTLLGEGIPLEAVRRQIASAIELIIHLERLSDGRRVVMEILEVAGFAGGEYLTNPLYRKSEKTGSLMKVGDLVRKEKLVRSEGSFRKSGKGGGCL